VSTLWRPVIVGLALVLATNVSRGEDVAMSPPVTIREITSSRVLHCEASDEPETFAAGVFFGDEVATAAQMRAAVGQYERRYGQSPGLVKTFASFADDFSAGGRAGQMLRTLLEIPGVAPMVSLEPTWHGSPSGGLLDLIASGRADGRIARVGRDLASMGNGPILIELAAEMNASFAAPWQAAANGDQAAPPAFVRAWRHIVDVMRAAGAHNARWVFAPSAGNTYTHRHTGPQHWAWYGHWYAGDAYVDYLGLHAFNNAREQGAWVPFIELVTGDAADRMLNDMIDRFPGRRIILGELATSEHPGYAQAKARWIADAYTRMRRCPAIAGAVWFDMDKEADWRIDSSPTSSTAYEAMVRGVSDGRREGQ
jgi:hypothetical protein